MPPSTLEPDRCPRCGGGFHCGAAEGRCDCFELQLSEALRARLAQRYPGRCLCLACLRELQCGASLEAQA
ncbi:cysteine-rich CWC family protein [Inhella sp.]|uniref:cysteine-rich CWC family protein n=1 Tax=Inhella sp. TaxID=1921806 RepID=UPI0035AFB8A7